MGIQLDWQIESEQKQRRATEDPQVKNLRRRQRRRLLVVLVGFGLGLCLVVGAIVFRLRMVEERLRQDLLTTVDAEVRALKIGDRSNYMAIRRSGSEYWMDLQRQTFDEYQQLKDAGRLELTGVVLDVEMDIDNSRARVVVEEKVNGITYEVVWFYWLYTDDEQNGWRRVPPDIDFWGDQAQLRQGQIQVNYYALDKTFAEALAMRLSQWWGQVCLWLVCPTDLPPLAIDIEPRSPSDPAWDLYNNWKLVMSSPLYAGRMRRDAQLPPEIEHALAYLIAERVVQYGLSPSSAFVTNPYFDADFLVKEYQTWLVGRMLGDPTQGSVFFEGIVQQYGDGVPGLMLRVLNPETSLGALLQATLPSVNSDTLQGIEWSSFFQWRLDLELRILRRTPLNITEDEMLIRHNALYDERDGTALQTAAYYRNQFAVNQPSWRVQAVSFIVDELGRLNAIVTADDQMAMFRWADVTWKRVS